MVELDPTVPPFSKANVPSEVTLPVHLNRVRPLSESKWVKSGDVHEWLYPEVSECRTRDFCCTYDGSGLERV
jgi:hypothetical protein